MQHQTSDSTTGERTDDRSGQPNAPTNSFIKKMADNLHQPLIGKTVAEKYEILELIGSGAFGSVYKAKHLSLNKTVALKILRADYVEDKKIASRFQHEATITSHIHNPHVVAVFDHDICKETKVVFIAMEYIPGPSLKDVMQGKSLDVERSIGILIQLCDGITAAHNDNILHRDIKPSNILLTDYEHNPDFVKVTDFGIAKVLDESEELKRLTLTGTGEVMGTYQYMSPEQCKGEKVDYRSDIYALGCVLFELLTGDPPFHGGPSVSVISRHVMEPPPPLVLTSVDPIVGNRLAAIAAKALEKEPSIRYQSAQELRTDLEIVQNKLKQLKTARTNALVLAVENLGLTLTQATKRLQSRTLSKKLPGVTFGSILTIASLVLVLTTIAIATLLFSDSFMQSTIANRELPMKPVVDSSTKITEQKLAESVWAKLQSSSLPRWSPILEDALKLFIRLADSSKQSGNYELARWWYYRSELVLDWLKQDRSIMAARVYSSYAESCLLANTTLEVPDLMQTERLKKLVKTSGEFTNPQVFRDNGLTYAANAATARDAALGSLTKLEALGTIEASGKQIFALQLLSQGLLAESFRELSDTEEAKKAYDKFYTMLSQNNLYTGLDKAQYTYLLLSAGKFFLQHNEPVKAADLFTRLQSLLTEFGNLANYELAVAYNDLGLVKEIENKNIEAELFFKQSYDFLTASSESTEKYKTLLLNNLATASLKAGDYRDAIRTKLKTLTKLSL